MSTIIIVYAWSLHGSMIQRPTHLIRDAVLLHAVQYVQ